jgi:hypothetical protein
MESEGPGLPPRPHRLLHRSQLQTFCWSLSFELLMAFCGIVARSCEVSLEQLCEF